MQYKERNDGGRDVACYTVISANEENDDVRKGILKCVEGSVLDRVARV